MKDREGFFSTLFVVVLIVAAFYGGRALERWQWTSELEGRGIAHFVGEKIVWDKGLGAD